MAEWTTKQIAEHYCRELAQAFEAENEEFLEEERIEVDRIRARCVVDGTTMPPGLEPRPSFMWSIFGGTEIRCVGNLISAVLPQGFAIFPDLIQMFDKPSVCWGRAQVTAIIVEHQPRVAIEVLLVDSWDDDRQAAWIIGQHQRLN